MLVPYAGKERAGYELAQPRVKPSSDAKMLRKALRTLLARSGCTTKERAEILFKINPNLARAIADLAREKTLTPTMTRRQNQVKWFIEDFFNKHGIAPTYSEIGEAIGVSKVAAFNLVKRMEERGIVRLMAHRSRSIVLVKEAA